MLFFDVDNNLGVALRDVAQDRPRMHRLMAVLVFSFVFRVILDDAVVTW